MYSIRWEDINNHFDLVSAKEANTISSSSTSIKKDFYGTKNLVHLTKIEILKTNLEKSTIRKIAGKILGATYTSEGLTYVMKWEGIDNIEFISAEDVNLIYPQIIFKFYEEKFL